MKIEIDLDDIFRGEDGEPGESLEESVRRQITDRLTGDLRKRLFDRLDATLSAVLSQEVAKVVQEKMPSLIDDIMNSTYTPVSSYGERRSPTTFRNAIVEAVAGQMKYEPKNYSSDENAFTRAVKSIVEKQTQTIKDEITKQVDTNFARDALTFAVQKLSERLGLTPAKR